MKVLVLGATGFCGGAIARHLAARGFDVVCARRARANVLGIRKLPQQLVDLDDPVPFRGDAYDAIVHAAGFYPRDGLDPEGAHRRARAQTTAVLTASGATPLVYISSTATVAPAPHPSRESDTFASAPGFGLYHDLKWAMEQRFAARPHTRVLCPAGVLGEGDWRVGTCAPLVALGRGQLPPVPDGIVSLVDVVDVCRAVEHMLGPDAPPRMLLSTASVRFSELLARLAVRYGVPAPPPPLSDAEAVAWADAEEHAAAIERRRPRLARELVDLLIHGVPIDASLAHVELHGLRDLDSTLDAFDAWARRVGLLPPSPGASPCPFPNSTTASAASSPT